MGPSGSFGRAYARRYSYCEVITSDISDLAAIVRRADLPHGAQQRDGVCIIDDQVVVGDRDNESLVYGVQHPGGCVNEPPVKLAIERAALPQNRDLGSHIS